jgi:hypothetical protein
VKTSAKPNARETFPYTTQSEVTVGEMALFVYSLKNLISTAPSIEKSVAATSWIFPMQPERDAIKLSIWCIIEFSCHLGFYLLLVVRVVIFFFFSFIYLSIYLFPPTSVSVHAYFIFEKFRKLQPKLCEKKTWNTIKPVYRLPNQNQHKRTN